MNESEHAFTTKESYEPLVNIELNSIHENGSAKFLRHGIAPAEMPHRGLVWGVVSRLIHQTESTHTNKLQPRTWPNIN
jgi:hypothetical protein